MMSIHSSAIEVSLKVDSQGWDMADFDAEQCADLLRAINPYDALHLATDASKHAASASDQKFWYDVIAALKRVQQPSSGPSRDRFSH